MKEEIKENIEYEFNCSIEKSKPDYWGRLILKVSFIATVLSFVFALNPPENIFGFTMNKEWRAIIPVPFVALFLLISFHYVMKIDESIRSIAGWNYYKGPKKILYNIIYYIVFPCVLIGIGLSFIFFILYLNLK